MKYHQKKCVVIPCFNVANDVFTTDRRFADVTEHDWMQPLFDKLMKLLEDIGFGKYYVVQADLNKATDVPSHYRMLYVPCCTPDCIDLDIQTGEKGIFKLITLPILIFIK